MRNCTMHPARTELMFFALQDFRGGLYETKKKRHYLERILTGQFSLTSSSVM